MSKDEVRAILNTLEPVIGKKEAGRYWRVYLLEDRDGRESLQRELECVQEKLTRQGYSNDAILLNPPDEKGIEGSLPVGRTHYNGRDLGTFSVSPQQLLTHFSVFGQSGRGKTNLAYILLLNLLREKIPFLVLDWKKNYRDLKGFAAGRDVQVYTVGKKVRPFSFNPLIPPKGTPPKSWLKKLVEIIGKAYYVGEGVISILHKGIDAVYEDAGVYDSAEVARWPTMRDVKNWVDEYVQRASFKELKAQWIASTGRTLQSLCFGNTDQILNTEIDAVSLETLLDRPVVLELDGLTENDKTMIIESILLWVHHYRLQERDREKLRHVILIEEAHHVLRKAIATEKEGIIDVVIREIRELGEGLVMISQSPSNFSQNAIANSSTSFCFALKDKTDVLTAAKFLLLDKEQESYLHNLPVGYCIAKTQGIPKPFLLHLPHVPVKKGSTTDALIREQEDAGGWPRILDRVEKAGRACQEAIEVFTDDEYGATGYSPSSSSKSPGKGHNDVISHSGIDMDKLQRDEIEFLTDVRNQPFTGIASRYKRLKISTKNGNKMKDDLLAQGLVEVSEIKTREGRTKLLELTPKGAARLQDRGIKAEYVKLSNGVGHRYWKNRVGEHFKNRGYTIGFEKPLGGGKRVDIEAVKPGERIAIEIETGDSHTITALQPDIEQYDKVLVVATDDKALTKCQREVGKLEDARKVTIVSVDEF